MSPTEDMLIRIADLFTFGGSKSTLTGASSVGITIGSNVVNGVLPQAAICSVTSAVKIRTKLVTEFDAHNVNLVFSKSASRHI